MIDEVHNVCPAEPQDPLVALATDRAIRIAADGRKFGLYLPVSTQRPQKIPENVLSQADNLVLLRLNSLADAAFAQAVFSPEPALLRFGADQRGGRRRRAGDLGVCAVRSPAQSSAVGDDSTKLATEDQNQP